MIEGTDKRVILKRKVSLAARRREVELDDEAGIYGRLEATAVEVKLDIAVPLDDEDIGALCLDDDLADAVRHLRTSSKGKAELDGANTIKLSIKRDFPTGTYMFEMEEGVGMDDVSVVIVGAKVTLTPVIKGVDESLSLHFCLRAEVTARESGLLDCLIGSDFSMFSVQLDDDGQLGLFDGVSAEGHSAAND